MTAEQYNELKSISQIYTVRAEDRSRILSMYKQLIQNRFLCKTCDSVVLDCLQKLRDLHASNLPFVDLIPR